jgi:peptide deformylase
MSILPIRALGSPVLRERCREVETFDELLGRLYQDMVATMYEAPGVGLAAPQVGLSLRFFVFDSGDDSGPHAVANPVLSGLEGSQTEEEGCLSIQGLWYPTPRAMHARVDGLDLKGRPVSFEGEGLQARIFQHETDHVNGLLFIDRLSDEDRRQAMAQLREIELGLREAPGRRSRR